MNRIFVMTVVVATGLWLATSPALASCNACNIQTKVASTAAPGKFTYRITCIDDSSGDEVTSNITAATDDEAMKAAAAKCN